MNYIVQIRDWNYNLRYSFPSCIDVGRNWSTHWCWSAQV